MLQKRILNFENNSRNVATKNFAGEFGKFWESGKE